MRRLQVLRRVAAAGSGATEGERTNALSLIAKIEDEHGLGAKAAPRATVGIDLGIGSETVEIIITGGSFVFRGGETKFYSYRPSWFQGSSDSIKNGNHW